MKITPSLILIAGLIAGVNAWAIDTYDSSTGQLTIPMVQVGSTTYANVVISVVDVLSIGSSYVAGQFDVYNSANNQLTIPSVRVNSVTYNNVIITVGTVLSVGGAFSNPNLSVAGAWIPVNSNQLSSTFNGGLAPGFEGLIQVANSEKYSVVVTGWNFNGLDAAGKNILVNIGLFTPNDSGDLFLNTNQYIKDPSTNGAGSVVTTDFNGDGLTDIFLAAHTESPMTPLSSTAYLQNVDGTFNKIDLGDKICAHDAKLVTINNTPMVSTTTFNATTPNTFAAANPIYYFNNNQFSTLLPNQSWNQIASLGDGSLTYLANLGMSSAIDDFGTNGQMKLIRSDNTTFTSDWSKTISSDISIYSFSYTGLISKTPDQRITPYLSTLPQYQNYKGMYGLGLTHTYRVWSEDFNHDGHFDLISEQSMWTPQANDWPNAMQLLLNDGTEHFVDQTAKLNLDMSLNSDELSYTPVFIDLDHSGIKSFLFSNHGSSGYDRHTNYVLLNDGTGRIYVALHDQFLVYAKQVIDFLQNDKTITAAYNILDYPYGNPVSFIPLPQPDGSINFLAEINSSKKDISNQAVYIFANYKLGYNPATNFTQNITITDRNQSKLMRTWAGNDVIMDTNANAAPAHIDGGLGVNTAVYSDVSANYSIKSLGTAGYEVKHTATNAFANVDDTLINIQYLKFSDTNLTLPFRQ